VTERRKKFYLSEHASIRRMGGSKPTSRRELLFLAIRGKEEFYPRDVHNEPMIELRDR
jgi:hypothetical protein